MRLVVALGVAVLAVLGTASAKPSHAGSCSKKDEGVTYGIASDCQKYLVCKKGSLEVKECKSKSYYDTVTGSCVNAAAATCAVETNPEPEPQPEPAPEPEPEETGEQYDYLCQKVLYGVRVHPNACDKYLVCNKDKATIEQCEEGFIFVADFISCVPGNKVTCTVQSDEPSTTESPPSTSNESKESESAESESREDSSETSDQYDYLCAKTLLGSVAHPESCTKYISCYKNKATEQSCKKGYSYSSQLHLCIKQKNGACADAPQEYPTTEAAPVEPEPTKPGSEETGPGEESSETSGQYDYLCAKTLLGSVAHPESCTKYISCYKNKATEQSCKKGYSYSSQLHLCIKQKNGACADAPQEYPTTEAAPVEPEPTKPGSEETGSGEESSETSGQYDYLCAKTLLGSVAHPESCTKYISCYKNKATEQNCKKGYSYSSQLHLCIKQKNGACADAPQEYPTTEAAPVEPEPTKPGSEETGSGEDSSETSGQYDYLCAKTLLGSVAHPESCTKYISCYKNKATEQSCKKGYSYSSQLHLCIKQKNGACADAPQEYPTTEAAPVEPEPTKPGSEETGSGEDSSETSGQYDYLCAKTLLGSVAHPESCTKYISCYKNKATEQSCKKGYSYSSQLHLCIKQKNGACADAPQEYPTTEAAPVEPEPTKPGSEETGSGEDSSETSGQYDYLCAKTLLGSVAHPESCTKYISCFMNKATELSCNEGYYFSVYLRFCIQGNSETCADNNGGNHGTSSTEPPQYTEEPTTELFPPATGGDPGEINNGCVEGFTGYLPIENDCTSYVYCFQGEPGVKTCLENYIYYDPFKACLPGDPVLCQLYSV